MRLSLLLFLLFALGCHQDVAPYQQLYGKWILTDGTALAKRQLNAKSSPVYFTFTSYGSIESNWSNCYSFRFKGNAELIVNNNCVDCLIPNCDQSVWRYSFNGGNKLTIEFGPDDVGFLRKE